MTLGSVISLSHPTPIGLVWREFGGLNLDQWVLGYGEVYILDQFRCDSDAPEAKLQYSVSITLLKLVWFGVSLGASILTNGY